MSDRKRLGLSLEKDGGYSKLIVFMSAVLSGFTFGLPGFLGALTVEVSSFLLLGIISICDQFWLHRVFKTKVKSLLVERWKRTEFATSNSRYSSSLDTRISLCWFNGGFRQVFQYALWLALASHWMIRWFDQLQLENPIQAYYQVMSPRHWLFISSLTGTIGWLLLYSASYAPVEYFHYFQYGFGVLAGIGSGFAFGLIILTPQHWLDKE